MRLLSQTERSTRPALLALVMLMACRTTPSAPPLSLEYELKALPDDAIVYYDDRSGIGYRARIVVFHGPEWNGLWREATSTRSQPPSQPEVDFEEQMLLVVASGESIAGARVEILKAGIGLETLHDEPLFEIHVRTVRGCASGMDLVIQPLVVARVKRWDGPVSFVEIVEQGPCD